MVGPAPAHRESPRRFQLAGSAGRESSSGVSGSPAGAVTWPTSGLANLLRSKLVGICFQYGRVSIQIWALTLPNLARRQKRWLQDQLAQQALRSWRIETFGEGRMALLVRHGLERGDQLLERIDQLTPSPASAKGCRRNCASSCRLKSNCCTHRWPQP
jgi:hypothetical protein